MIINKKLKPIHLPKVTHKKYLNMSKPHNFQQKINRSKQILKILKNSLNK